MPSYPSKPKTLAGDGGLATAGETLRLRSGQAASASLRAGCFGFAQGGLLRLRSGQAASASLRARLLRLRSGQAPSASLRAGCRRYSVFSRYGGFSQAVKALADTIAMQN